MSVKPVQKVVFAVIVALLLLASFIAGRSFNKPMDVQAQEVLYDEDRAWVGFSCNINEVALITNRLHVRCVNTVVVGTDTVRFFAVANTEANKTFINRVIAIGMINITRDRWVYLHFDDSAANNPTGCAPSDCRKLITIYGLK